jgi:GxxExxY protein
MQLRTQTPLSDEEENLARRVIGAAIEVHTVLGPGFGEFTYQRALEIELNAAGIRFRTQMIVPLSYRGQPVGSHRLDLVIDDVLIVELKAVDRLHFAHRAIFVQPDCG